MKRRPALAILLINILTQQNATLKPVYIILFYAVEH